MLDADLEALNIYKEAGAEPDEGKAAIARVVRNRMRLHYSSDGTMAGTILARDQFSWAYFDWVNGKYVRVCSTKDQAALRAQRLFVQAPAAPLAHCADIAQRVAAGVFIGPGYVRLGYDAVHYLNPRILTKLPDWATSKNYIVSIGHHDFYRAAPPPLVA
jgi:spore germination cell wall hydrolase CwlJ-like protein